MVENQIPVKFFEKKSSALKAQNDDTSSPVGGGVQLIKQNCDQ